MSLPIHNGTGEPIVSVLMGQWAVATAPMLIRTLLGSCAGVVLYEKSLRLGGVAHIVLPDSRGATEQPGKYANTAIPGLIEEMERHAGRKIRSRLTAKVFGGARMFQSGASVDIGKSNQVAVEQILERLCVPILARDLGGESGRRLTFSTASGMVTVRPPGGTDYEV